MLRFADVNDVPAILWFIRQLAAYEKLEHEVAATEEELTRSLFGDRRVAEVILAELPKGEAVEEAPASSDDARPPTGRPDREPVGFALFFHNYSTFLGKAGIYLEDLFVRPEYRGSGYGKELLQALAKIAVDRGCGRLEWWVLDWNTPSIDFYRSIGAKPMDEWTVFRLGGDGLKELARKERQIEP